MKKNKGKEKLQQLVDNFYELCNFCDELDIKKSMTIIIGLGETEKDIPELIKFVNDYKIPFTTFSINTFETAYYNHLANYDMEFDFLERPEIKPRKIDRYFTSLTKNARFIRKDFHAFMVQKNYVEGNVYSFHNIGATPFNHYDLGWAKKFNLINDGISDEQWLAEVSSPYYVDDIDFVGEWNFNNEVSTTGINLTHETHAFVDMAGIKLNKIEIHMTRKFFCQNMLPCLDPKKMKMFMFCKECV